MLIIVFRAVGAPLVTLLPAIWVLLMSGAIIAEASKAGLQVSTITETMLTVLLLGAGTDYGLFFIMRVREEIAAGASPHQAIERCGPVRGRVDHVLGGHGDRRPALPAAGLVRPVLRARPGAGAGRVPHAARRADPAARAARGVRPGGVLAAPGPGRQAGRPLRPARRPCHRAPGRHPGLRRGVPGRAGRVRGRVHLERIRRHDHRPGREPVSQRHQRDQQPLPGRRGQPDPGADGLPEVGLEGPHARPARPRPTWPGSPSSPRSPGRSIPTAPS